MTDSTYTDLVDIAVIDRARALHNDATTRLQQAEAGVTAAQAAVADAEANAQCAAAGETDLDPLAAEHAFADRNIELASAVRVRDAALAKHTKTEKNIVASEAMAYRPVAIAAGRARLEACAEFDDAMARLAAADAKYLAADKQGQQARAHGCAFADNGLSTARSVRDERIAWRAIAHAVDIDAGTFAGPPNGYIS